MTFDDQTDPYDPELAERFSVLEQLTPPPAPVPAPPRVVGAAPAPRTEAGGPLPSTGELVPAPITAAGRRRRTVLLGAAAAVVVAAGLAIFAFADGAAGPGLVEAGPATGSEDVDASTGASADASGGSDENAGSDGADDSSAEAITIEVPDEDTGSSDGSDESAASTTTGTAPETTATSEDTATTATTAGGDGGDPGDQDDADGLIPKYPTVPDPPTGSIIVPGAGQLVTVTGIVTEVLLDCQSWMVLNEDGVAEHRGGVSCDGGSFIVVDGTRIQTSSGFVSADLAFDNHPVALQPGTFVTVTATKGPYGGLTLDCRGCGVSR